MVAEADTTPADLLGRATLLARPRPGHAEGRCRLAAMRGPGEHLWDYSEFKEQRGKRPLHFVETRLGCSTVCAVRANSGEMRPKGHRRRVLAVGRLSRPYSAR
jgi:hypothetical protein